MADVAAFGPKQRRVRAHRDFVGGGADFQTDIDSQRLCNKDINALAYVSFEAGQFGRYRLR